jgi:hypothetical protein
MCAAWCVGLAWCAAPAGLAAAACVCVGRRVVRARCGARAHASTPQCAGRLLPPRACSSYGRRGRRCTRQQGCSPWLQGEKPPPRDTCAHPHPHPHPHPHLHVHAPRVDACVHPHPHPHLHPHPRRTRAAQRVLLHPLLHLVQVALGARLGHLAGLLRADDRHERGLAFGSGGAGLARGRGRVGGIAVKLWCCCVWRRACRAGGCGRRRRRRRQLVCGCRRGRRARCDGLVHRCCRAHGGGLACGLCVCNWPSCVVGRGLRGLKHAAALTMSEGD